MKRDSTDFGCMLTQNLSNINPLLCERLLFGQFHVRRNVIEKKNLFDQKQPIAPLMTIFRDAKYPF